jgi:site-specific DNA-methyltransferase (adenine-specific)
MTLLNGDCLKQMESLEAESVDCIITDPPYGVGFKNNFYDDSEEAVLRAIPNWYKEWHRVLKKDSYLFIFVGVKTIHHWINEGIAAGYTYKNIIAARSFNNGSINPKNNFGFQFQPVLVFSKGKGKAFNEYDFIPTSEAWLKDKRNKNPKPYTYQYPNFIKTEWGFATAKRASKALHPNEKNIDFIKFLIGIATNEGDVVLDSFAGCGSTGVACANTNREFIGMELDEKYFNIAKERIEVA